MERFIELIKMQSYAEFRLFIEYWWIWIIIILLLMIVGYFIREE
jgi:hypothetical protein